MKGIFVIEGTLTLFDSLGGDIDTIGSLRSHRQLGSSLKGVYELFTNYSQIYD
jgi:hypothetical protein